MPKTPEELIRHEICALSAYHVPDSSGFIKLDAMENPYSLPPALRDEIAQLSANAAINRYPDPQALRLKERLRDAMEIPADADIMLGNGSDELIQIVAMALARPGACLLSLEPSFVMFRMIATFVGMRYVGVTLNQDFSLPVDEALHAVRAHQPALIFIAFPNNPTGNLYDADAVLRLIEAAPGVVVIDEAYAAFSEASFLSLLPRYQNLLVMRTLSKSGLAGLRLGYLVGNRRWLTHFDKIRLPYNINVLTQLTAARVLQDADVLNKQAEDIKSERSRLIGGLGKIPVVRAYPSSANFVLLRIENADKVFRELKRRNILVKNLNGAHSLLDNCLRVTVGTAAENDYFLQALKEL